MRDHICPPDHKHGETSTCYTSHRCGCAECREAAARRVLARRRAKLYGRYQPQPLVDSKPALEHVIMLGEFGIGYGRIAETAGVSKEVIRALIYGRRERDGSTRPKQRIHAVTEAAILKVKPDISNLAPGAFIPSRGTIRRLQALMANGWDGIDLAAGIPCDHTNLWRMMNSRYVTVKRHHEVTALFNKLWDKKPQPTTPDERGILKRTLALAESRRYLPAMAWDDIDTDEEPPAAEAEDTVDHVAVDFAISGVHMRLTPAERREVVTVLHRRGLSDGGIGEATGMSPQTAYRIRKELGLAANYDEAGKIA